MVVDGSSLMIGKDGSTIYRSAYRFTNIKIPKGAIITKAIITLAYNWKSGLGVKTILYGEDSDNAAAFIPKANDISNRPRTTANVKWNDIHSGSWGMRLTSPDITSIVQEIVNRDGWSDGNSLTILQYEDPASTDVWEAVSFEDGGTEYSHALTIELLKSNKKN